MEIEQSQSKLATMFPIFSDNRNNKYQDNKLIKRINKKKNEIQRRVQYKIIQLDTKYYGKKIFGDLMVTSSGQMKLNSALIHVSFGQLSKGQSIEFNKDTNCYQIKLAPCQSIPHCAMEDALKLINRQFNNINLKVIFEELARRISTAQQKFKYLYSCESQVKRNDEQFDCFSQTCLQYLKNKSQNSQHVKKEEENMSLSFDSQKQYQIIDHQDCYYLFQQKEKKREELKQISQTFSSFIFDIQVPIQCQNASSFYLDQLKEIPCSGMFTYAIGRLNWEDNNLETVYQGYSKGYLDLLGLDEQSLINLSLRDKEVDLVRDASDITMYSALQMNSRISGHPLGEDSLNIVTFDGFPLKIYQKQKKILFNEFQNFNPTEFILSMTEIDVDLNDLQNLMNYRQQLATQQNLSIDILIQKELSYKFEDIEYSVHSENFIDKYYKDNLNSLQNINHKKIVSEQKQRCQIKQLESNDCSQQIEIISS